jgi:hypothetical protein
MQHMTDRKQARAMDLPDYPCPPFVRDIPNHAGSWGWVNGFSIVQDDDGYLWADGNATPLPVKKVPWATQVLLAWSDVGLTLYAPPESYQYLKRITGELDRAKWIPVARVMKEPPTFLGEDDST